VLLTTAAQAEGTVYTVTVNGVTDASGTAIAANSTIKFTAWKVTPGWATREIYFGISGQTVADFKANDRFTARTPDKIEWVKGFESFRDPFTVNYGARLNAFFIPPSNGTYTFYLNGDDESELFLRSNQSQANLKSLGVVAISPVGFDDAFSVNSGASLTAGTRYLMEGLLQQGAGDVYLRVGAKAQGSSTPAANVAVLAGNSIGTFVNPDIGNVQITAQPAAATATVGSRAKFSVKVKATESPVYYQWRVNGADIPNAIRSSYITPELTDADNGKMYSVVVSVAGKDTPSADAKLSVTAGDPSPLQPYVAINFVVVGNSLPGPMLPSDVAGIVWQDNWNNLGGFTYDNAPLVDAKGAATPVAFSATATGNWYTGTFARGLNGPVATELAPDGSLLVLNRGAVWRDSKKFVPNAGSLIRICYVGGSTPASGTPVSDPARSSTNLAALGLPMEASALPKRLTRAEWDARLRGVRRWPFWLNTSAWQPFTHEVIGLYLPTNAAARLSADNTEVLLPPGAVVVRNFSVTHWRAKPAKGDEVSRPVETRLLVVGAPRSYGAGYRWKTPDLAELIEDGELETLTGLADANSTNDTPQKVSLPWWFPGVDDGLSFPLTNPAYWISTSVQDFIFPPAPARPGRPVNWLRSMQRAGALITTLTPEKLDQLPHGVMWSSPLEPSEQRVRSYLHGNCAVCHQPGGASRGNLDLRLTTPLAQTGLLHGEPQAGDPGLAGAKIVTPGAPEKSILLRRLKDTGFFRMPAVQYHNEPSPIIPVMEEWIRSRSGPTNSKRP